MSQLKIKPEKKKPTVIVISFDKELNQVQCDGPFDDGVTFLGMLAMAKFIFMEGRIESMVDYKLRPKPNERKIIIPNAGPN